MRRAAGRAAGVSPVWLLNLFLSGVAAAGYVLGVRHLHAFGGQSLHLAWPILAVAFCVVEIQVIHLRFRAEAHSISVNELPLVLGLIFATPTGLILAQVVGAAMALVFHRRQAPVKLAFNLSNLALQTVLALVVFHALVDGHDPTGAVGWGVALLAAVTCAAVALANIVGAIVLSQARVQVRQAAETFALGLAATFTTTNLGVIAASLLATKLYLVAPLVVLTAVLVVAYQAYAGERARRDSLEFLFRASQVTQSSRDLDEIFVELLEHARAMFHADVAEIVMFAGDEGQRLVRTTVGLTPEPEVMVSTESPLTRMAIEAAAESPGVILDARSGVEGLSGNAMVARLAGEERPLGALVASNPKGVVSPFNRDHLRLFQTLANHVTLTLENGDLERSITQLRELERQLSYKAFHDPLTTLANRALFRTRLQESIDRGTPGLAVLFIDLDDFKTVNDTLGHAAGDRLLTVVGERIGQCARVQDLAARLGGDEFAILLEGVGNEEAARVAIRVLSAVRAPIEIEDRSVSIQTSVGVAVIDHHSADADEFMRNADIAMYTAKRNGKGCYEFFQPEMSAAVMLRHQLKQDLKRAADHDEFENHYQTMVDLRTREVVAVEALVRWNHPWAGLVTPEEFIPLAEETGAIVGLGRHVLVNACRDAAAWRYFNPALCVSVNLSARQLEDDDLLDDVRHALTEAGLPPEALILEITETMAMGNLEEVIGRLKELKALGVQIAMDDFGTGYSSLAQIRRLPIDMVKIPKPFMDQMTENSEGLDMVHAITRLSQTLGLGVVAEGIEEEHQYLQLQDLPCMVGQGFFFSRPVPAHFMTQLLAADAGRHRVPA
ncbi:MAG TPA: EAL domain-containing protein [Acidimicrobiales bacterium]|nr:EAL domain-containing protein [Acidimicrobiales bacterium]